MPSRIARVLAVFTLLGLVVFLVTGTAGVGRAPARAQAETPGAESGHAGHVEGDGQPAAATQAASPRSTYADGFDPAAAIRSLTPEEIAGIEVGAGAGYALPAEVNGVPGPRHVLELAGELGLSADQIAAVQAVADEMLATVVPAGHRYLDAVEALEADLRAGTLTEVDLTVRVVEVGRLEGELAAAHLVAHLQTAALLSPEQTAAYNRLRGYR